jgi:hypothetical protein
MRRLVLLSFAILSSGCLLTERGTDGGNDPYCNPTGYVLSGSGVSIGPEGCEEVTLYRTDAAKPDTYVLRVFWPMHDKHDSLYLTNKTTNDTENEILYLGDPDFTLYIGDYSPGGLLVREGTNTIDYRTTAVQTDASGKAVTVETAHGTFSLVVHVTTSPGK